LRDDVCQLSLLCRVISDKLNDSLNDSLGELLLNIGC